MRRTDTRAGPATGQAPRTRAHVAQLLATAEQVRGDRDRQDRNARGLGVTPTPTPSHPTRDRDRSPVATPAPGSAVDRAQGAVSPVHSIFASARLDRHPGDDAEFAARNETKGSPAVPNPSASGDPRSGDLPADLGADWDPDLPDFPTTGGAHARWRALEAHPSPLQQARFNARLAEQSASDGNRLGAAQGSGRRPPPPMSIVASDGLGAHATSMPSVLSVAKAPTLRSLNRSSIVKFLDEWVQYETRTAGATTGRIQLRQAVEPKFLRALCAHNEQLKEFSVHSVPDEVLFRFLQSKVFGDRPSAVAPSIEAMEAEIRRKVRFDTEIEDHELRVDSFFAEFEEEIRLRGWQTSFGPEREKETTKFLATLLWPFEFRTVVKSEMQRRRTKTVEDFRKLVIVNSPLLDGIRIASRGSDCPDEFEPRPATRITPRSEAVGTAWSGHRQYARPSPPVRFDDGISETEFHPSGSPPSRSVSSFRDSSSGVSRDRGRAGPVRSPHVGGRFSAEAHAGSRDNRPPPSSGCFNCGGPHYVARCPTASTREGTNLVRRHSSGRPRPYPSFAHNSRRDPIAFARRCAEDDFLFGDVRHDDGSQAPYGERAREYGGMPYGNDVDLRTRAAFVRTPRARSHKTFDDAYRWERGHYEAPGDDWRYRARRARVESRQDVHAKAVDEVGGDDDVSDVAPCVPEVGDDVSDKALTDRERVDS